jgi:serine/threonine protein kinase/Tol biopolymer transport system component
MTPERYQQVGQLYRAALEVESDQRATFLAEACDGDEALRQDVESLLGYEARSGGIIDQPALEVAARELADQSMSGAQTQPLADLAPRRIGAYRLLEPLGRGGMGEVYLALDRRLNRKVAVKLLPAEFMTDAERVRRFQQEAEAASAINHPNIITIHEINVEERTYYIVTEYIEGETLRQRLANAPEKQMKLAEALDVAAQVAAALAAAHEAGIIHRDIKPENVMVRRDGIVKVLDFGLAKLTEAASPIIDSQAPTMARHSTEAGMVMGTPRYMSPEQARGEKVDARTDIFSLGVLLYEMLAGRAPFTGATARDCLAAILKDEPPDLRETNSKVPPQLERLVRRCLEKQPERRFHSAHDLGFALEALSTSSASRPDSQLDTATASSTAPENRRTSHWLGQARLAWIVAAALLLGMLGFAWVYFTRQPTADARVMKFSILPPEKSSFGQIAMAPDGRHLAFTAATGGKLQLWVRALDSTEAKALAGTQGAAFPFWSPDNRFIGFFADGQLRKIEATGGPVQTLGEAPLPLGGACWSRAGVILFGQVQVGLLRISATGGEVTQVTTFDKARQEITHRHPTFLPDGHHFLYGIQSGQKETRGVYLGSLDGTVKRRLLDDFTVIKYMAAVPGDTASGDGWLVFGRDGALLARPFDARRLEFTGEPFSLSDRVGSDIISSNIFTFSVSDNGVLVFDPSLKRQRRQYLWVDRRRQPINSLDVDAGLFKHWLSPDEKRFIADRLDPQPSTLDLWLYDVSGGNAARFTFDPANDFSPVWAPDGSRIVWASTREGVSNLYQKAASGAGEETLLLKPDHPIFPTDWSRDGRFIIYHQTDPKTKSDVWFLPAPGSGEAKPFPVVWTQANETMGTLSPDGRWLAYGSDASGRFEVYVQSFPGGGGKRQVSNGGGNNPRWRRNGRELFYYAGDGKLMAAPVRSGKSFEMGAPVSLFEFRAGTVQNFAPYAVTADGQRFLINAVVETEPNAPLTVVVNWAAGVKK